MTLEETANLTTITLPGSTKNQIYVTVSALDAGHLTLPEHLFITNADPNKRTTVPSLSFLIQHPSLSSSPTSPKPKNILFDLGIKRDISGYRPAQQDHIAQRQPVIISPDARESLIAGGLQPEDINVVILSHVHWDHVGTSSDFANAEFVVGSGTLDVLKNGDGVYYPAAVFNADELPFERTFELPPVKGNERESVAAGPGVKRTRHVWQEIEGVGPAIDYLGDGSVWVVDAPGHLTGHVNLLLRTGPEKWVYLGGDCCHDPRILHGECGIALYDDGKGALRSVHMDTEAARGTVGRVGRLTRLAREGKVREDGGGVAQVEVVVAHDGGWRERNQRKFWPGMM